MAFSILFFGCAETSVNQTIAEIQSKPKSNAKPDWFFNTSKDGKTGGVGISGIHINGLSAQRGLAISRAVDEIARQLGVKVSSVLKISTTNSSAGSNTAMESYSIHTVDGRSVTATISGIWVDPATDELYIWMTTNQ